MSPASSDVNDTAGRSSTISNKEHPVSSYFHNGIDYSPTRYHTENAHPTVSAHLRPAFQIRRQSSHVAPSGRSLTGQVDYRQIQTHSLLSPPLPSSNLTTMLGYNPATLVPQNSFLPTNNRRFLSSGLRSLDPGISAPAGGIATNYQTLARSSVDLTKEERPRRPMASSSPFPSPLQRSDNKRRRSSSDVESTNFQTGDAYAQKKHPNKRNKQGHSIQDNSADEDYHMEAIGKYLDGLNVETEPNPQESTTNNGRVEVDCCVANRGATYHKGQTVQLWGGDFLRIQRILLGDDDEYLFIGPLFRLNRRVGRFLPQLKDEVCWIVKVTRDKYDKGLTSGFVCRTLAHIQGAREVVLTNSRYDLKAVKRHESSDILWCRVKFIQVLEDKKARQVAVQFLNQDDADEDHRQEAELQRLQWREETLCFGSHRKPAKYHDLENPKVINLTEQLDETHLAGMHDPEDTWNEYTHTDTFCGAGGASSGAKDAGFFLKSAFDCDINAVRTYESNYARLGAECRQVDCTHWVTRTPENLLKTDTLHASPPCQFFSWAHTTPSAKDEANQVAIFVISTLLEKCKPRVMTMEETDGLFFLKRHTSIFHAVIGIFVDTGYSVAYTILNCADYGVPQNRKRLVICAAGPGEVLPPFPKPTHGDRASGLRFYNSVEEAIQHISPLDPLHYSKLPLDGPPRKPWKLLANCITRSGGNNQHPSGRPFTPRERCRLQGIKDDHKFIQGMKNPNGKTGLTINAQIGNAVPPPLAKAMYREISKSLRTTDRERQKTWK